MLVRKGAGAALHPTRVLLDSSSQKGVVLGREATGPGGNLQVRLLFLRGGGSNGQIPLRTQSKSSGDSGNSIVSRRHASVQNRDGKYVLVDLKSSNGVMVNRVRVAEHVLEVAKQSPPAYFAQRAQQQQEGDEIMLGGARGLAMGERCMGNPATDVVFVFHAASAGTVEKPKVVATPLASSVPAGRVQPLPADAEAVSLGDVLGNRRRSPQKRPIVLDDDDDDDDDEMRQFVSAKRGNKAEERAKQEALEKERKRKEEEAAAEERKRKQAEEERRQRDAEEVLVA